MRVITSNCYLELFSNINEFATVTIITGTILFI